MSVLTLRFLAPLKLRFVASAGRRLWTCLPTVHNRRHVCRQLESIPIASKPCNSGWRRQINASCWPNQMTLSPQVVGMFFAMSALLVACASGPQEAAGGPEYDQQTTHHKCRAFAASKQQVFVVSGFSHQTFDVPVGINQSNYIYCMEKAGYPLTQMNTSLETSSLITPPRHPASGPRRASE